MNAPAAAAAVSKDPIVLISTSANSSSSSSSGSSPTTNNYQSYEKNLQKVGLFNSVESFWRHYSYMAAPDTLPKDHNIYLFRNNLVPAWEVKIK